MSSFITTNRGHMNGLPNMRNPKGKAMIWVLWIVKSNSGRLYTEVTLDFVRNSNRKGKLMFLKSVESEVEGIKERDIIRGLSKVKKMEFMKVGNYEIKEEHIQYYVPY